MTDEKQWFTVTELSKRFGIPDATLRRYIRHHGHHLKLRKRHKSYLIADESIEVFAKIREAYASGSSIEDVEDKLCASGAPTVITVTDVDDGGRVAVNLEDVLLGLQKAVDEQNNMIQSFEEVMKEQMSSQRVERVTELFNQMAS